MIFMFVGISKYKNEGFFGGRGWGDYRFIRNVLILMKKVDFSTYKIQCNSNLVYLLHKLYFLL